MGGGGYLWKYVETIQIWLKSDKNVGTEREDVSMFYCCPGGGHKFAIETFLCNTYCTLHCWQWVVPQQCTHTMNCCVFSATVVTLTRQKAAAYRVGGFGGGFKLPPPPRNSEGPPKIVPNSTRLWKLLKIAEFRTPTPQDVQKKRAVKF